MMTCPKCEDKTHIVYSVELAKSYEDAGNYFEARIPAYMIRRRRECNACGYRFSTLEKIIEEKKKK